ncbi:MAG: TetR family transcriptional regulator [Caulobacter sp.]|nr:TetR family transcriptional regulator [Caulobacter sp.]
MPAAPKHRAAIVAAAAALFRRNGYAATGLADITARSGAPKGSLYHYFPAGKAQIGEAAVRAAGETVRRTFAEIDAETGNAGRLIRAYAGRLAGWVEQSGWRDGCPITTVLLETAADDDRMRAAGRAAFDGWTAVVAEALARDGAEEARALTLARLAISALEGALILARVEQDAAAILSAGDEMAALFAREG